MHDDLLSALNEDRINEARIGFKYPEHDGEITKEEILPTGEDEKKTPELIEEEEETSKSSIVLWILSGIFIIIILALVGVFLIYPSMAKVPDVVIPNVTKMTVIEAEQALKKLGFEVATKIEYVGDDEIEKGLVVKTSPSIGRTVKKGTEIILYESTGKVAYVIENYVGKNYIEVKTILENNYGLHVVIEKMEPEDDKEHDEQEILKQDLEVGTEVAKGTNITLYIPDIIVEYPDFTDGTWTEGDIQEFCKQYELNVNFEYVNRPGYQNGEIISQDRISGSPVIKGVTITITINTISGEVNTEGEVPDEGGSATGENTENQE